MKYSEAVKTLKSAGIENPRHEARLIFEDLCGVEKNALFSSDPESQAADGAVLRRANGEPLQYIIGKTTFFNEEYFVSPDCLIPRSDTEILVELAIKNLKDGDRFIDLCTGSGCIAVSTLKNTKSTSALALDISEGALKIAKRNAEHNGVTKRLDFVLADAFEYTPCEVFDAVLSNPPYIERSVYQTLKREIFHEPKIALLAEELGLAFYKRLIPLYKSRVKRGGFMAFEIGYDQGNALIEIAKENGLCAKIIKDYGGNDRVAFIRV